MTEIYLHILARMAEVSGGNKYAVTNAMQRAVFGAA